MNPLTLSVRSQRTQLTRKLAAVALVGVFTAFAPLHAAAQVAANHAAIWTGGDTIYVDLAGGVDQTRAVVPGWGASTTPYQNLQFAVQDVLQNAPQFPVVFNIIGAGVTHQVSDLRLPAYGVKLQPYLGSTVTLDGGGGPLSGIQNPPVLRVDSEGPRVLPDGGVTPASIIQGFTITGGGIGVDLNVLAGGMATDPPQPLRTEVRDCIITENKYGSALGIYRGGTGIRIVSWGDAPTQYVIENNQIFDQADFFPGWASSGGPSSWGIYIEGRQNSRESSLIRGNQIAQQETGIGITGPGQDSAWVRPRILSNFLAEHEQHVFSIGNCGPALVNNTVFRTRDYCEGPDRHIVHHSATPTPLGSDPYNERTAMIVRNCIFDYFTPTPGNPNLALANDPIAPLPLGAVRPYDPIVTSVPPGTNVPWPIATFGGGGTVDVAFTDLDLPFGPLTAPRITPADLRALGVAWTPLFTPAAGNFQNRPVPFVNPAGQAQLPAPRPDLHLLAVAGVPTAPMIEGGDLASTIPGVMLNLDGELLPCDVRIDVDGDARACDFDSNGSLLPDRGADEVLDVQVGAMLALNSGLRLTSSADANGNVLNGATVAFTVQGRPNEAVMLLGWIDCPTSAADDVVFNHLFLPPVGNVLLPPCGLVNSAVLVLNAQGIATFSLPLAAAPEFQAYFQAVGLSAPGVPATGHASNRVRIELN
jgi:hypothetical protein